MSEPVRVDPAVEPCCGAWHAGGIVLACQLCPASPTYWRNQPEKAPLPPRGTDR